MSEELFDQDEIITLTDEDGKEERFIVLCVIEYNGAQYYALLPEKPEKGEEDGYVILRAEEEEGETMLVTVDDDDEFDTVADEIDEYLNSEIDYDEEDGE
ncbi:MAG: DUF1292 domain-containing protein [Clostridia bacterium]|nr:DUF1292 domain-containing protein [Clostridia bacterium]MBP5207318.1 DUF1292 domain-containing protein [Clostridia bacterium]